MTAVALTLAALLLELAIGYPRAALRTIGHPVTWMGRFIGFLDRHLNHETASSARRRAAGVAAVAALIAPVAAAGAAVRSLLLALPFGMFGLALVTSSLFAQRSLYKHVADVALALEKGGLARARTAVAHIVGRDVDVLDEAAVARAAIESLAENFSDAVVAPAFWTALLGFVGGAIYKAINTADSVIGHRTPRHEAFGTAAARLDDFVNLPASRLSALLLVAAAATSNRASAEEAWRTVWRDAHRHRSPNAGYPEAAMAGALGLALAGPRVYGGVRVADATMGHGRREANAQDIRAALDLYCRADALLLLLLTVIASLLAALA